MRNQVTYTPMCIKNTIFYKKFNLNKKGCFFLKSFETILQMDKR